MNQHVLIQEACTHHLTKESRSQQPGKPEWWGLSQKQHDQGDPADGVYEAEVEGSAAEAMGLAGEAHTSELTGVSESESLKMR